MKSFFSFFFFFIFCVHACFASYHPFHSIFPTRTEKTSHESNNPPPVPPPNIEKVPQPLSHSGRPMSTQNWIFAGVAIVGAGIGMFAVTRNMGKPAHHHE